MKNSDKHENQIDTETETKTHISVGLHSAHSERVCEKSEAGEGRDTTGSREDTAMTKKDEWEKEEIREWEKEIREQCKWDEDRSRQMDREDRDNEVEDKEEGEE